MCASIEGALRSGVRAANEVHEAGESKNLSKSEMWV